MAQRSTSRVALYSHDSTGLGHVRRNLLLAGVLSRDGHDVLLVSGSLEACSMARPSGIDLVTLPALHKGDEGHYEARHLHMDLDELITMRRTLLTSTLVSFQPDLLVVDRYPRGFLGELEPALERLTHTRRVLGLRDVLDAPERVLLEWKELGSRAALQRWYSEIWHYGSARLYEPLGAAGIVPPVPIVSTGYLTGDRPRPVVEPRTDAEAGPFALCMVGGGADGQRLVEAAVEAPLPAGLGLIVVTGPQMPAAVRARVAARARGREGVTVVDYLPDPERLLRRAKAAVVMGGYNTICEVLASDTPTLVVPRERPRLEQALRARALRDAASFDVLDVAQVSGRQLGWWLGNAIPGPRADRTRIDRDGLHRVGERAAALMRTTTPAVVARPPISTDGASSLALVRENHDGGVTRAAV